MEFGKRLTGMSTTVGYKAKWYKEWFGEEYLAVYAHRNLNEAKKLIDLIEEELPLQKENLILDVACGNARHAKLLARKGYKIFGTDLSKTLLKSAKPSASNDSYPFLVQSDMRYIPFYESFDIIFSLFTSFGYFESEKMNNKVIEEFSMVLNKGGKLVIDFLNPEHVKNNLTPLSQRVSGKLKIKEERWIHSNRVHKRITINNEKEFVESVRLYSLKDIETMLNGVGMKLQKYYGEYDGSAYAKDSSRMILSAIKP
jgi:SAM-dependent methyltransferase